MSASGTPLHLERPDAGRLRAALAAADLGLLALAIVLAHVIRFAPDWFIQKWQTLLASPGLLAFAGLSGLALLTAGELYESHVLSKRRETWIRLTVAVAVWTVVFALATYARPSWSYGRGILALTGGLWLLFLIGLRTMLARGLGRQAKRPALVVGDPEATARVAAALSARDDAPWRAIDASDTPIDGLHEAAREADARLVILAADDERRLAADLGAVHFSGLPVVAASELWAWLDERLPLESLSPGLFLHQPGFSTFYSARFNRLTRVADIALALPLLALTSPFLGLAAIAIRLSDRGPALFRQTRIGRFGRPFVMLKLRTMRRDAEKDGPRFADTDDARVTGVGRLLRRSRLDELPQLLNVLRGEMSLVGPRPEQPSFVEQLSREIPFYAFRLAVPPGITGWAQINAPYAGDALADHRQKLEYDLYFIREQSLALYLLTLLRTISTALVGARRVSPDP